MKKRSATGLVLVSFMAGIWWKSAGSVFPIAVLVIGIAALLAAVAAYNRRRSLAILLAVAAFLLGSWRTDQQFRKFSEFFPVKKTEITGSVIRQPEQKQFFQEGIVGDEKTGRRVMVRSSKFQTLQYGDRVTIVGSCGTPENWSDDFDYRMYLAAKHISILCSNATVTIVDSNEGVGLYKILLHVRNRLEENVNRAISQPQSGLAAGLLFGGGNRLPDQTAQDFSRAGLTHIVAVSGYNVSLIAGYALLAAISIGLWRQHALWIAGIAIVFFVAMIGFPASAVRAGIMGGIVLGVMRYGRTGNALTALLLAGSGMIALNPFLLRWDIGFQLSFLATAGIIVFGRVWESVVPETWNGRFLVNLVLVTVSAQLATAPVILREFGSFTLVSLLANVLILPIVPVTMGLSFLTAIAVFLGPMVSAPISWLAHVFLAYEIFIAKIASQIELGIIQWEISALHVVLWYVGLVAVSILFIQRRSGTRATPDQ